MEVVVEADSETQHEPRIAVSVSDFNPNRSDGITHHTAHLDPPEALELIKFLADAIIDVQVAEKLA